MVYSFGRGDHGQLGHGDQERQLTPRVIEGLRPVRACAVAASRGWMTSGHNLVLGSNGALYYFGGGEFGRLGHGVKDDQLTPRVIEALRNVRIRGIAAGETHNLVLAQKP
jgi:alpha-tubulin suppressor-like RCC1 family protein